MYRIRAFCLAVALGLSLVATAAAQAQAQALTAANVEGFIRSIQEIRPLYDQSDSQQDINNDTVDADDKNWNIRDWLAQAALEPRVLAILKKHGFTPEDWSETATRVMQAYTTIRLGSEGLNARAQMQAGLAQLEQQPGLSAEQKAMLRQQMQQGMQQMDQLLEEAPKADQDAVRPFMTQLDAVFEVEE